MTARTGFAPAKVNLTLHVTGQRADGYHLLDSLVVFADIGDHLVFETGPEIVIDVTGPFAEGVPTDRRNLIWRAAELAGWTGRIVLEKNLPHGAGIGGGSSDAAATLTALGAPDQADKLGADVPVCLARLPQRMRGVGHQIDAADGVGQCWAVLVWPGVGVSTPTVFSHLKNKNNPAMPAIVPRFEHSLAMFSWLREMRNDLQETCADLVPEVASALDALAGCDGIGLARMSGSGSTCFGLFETLPQADAAARAIAGKHPDWWVKPCVLGTAS